MRQFARKNPDAVPHIVSAVLVVMVLLVIYAFTPTPPTPIEMTFRYRITINGKSVECVRHIDHVHNVSTNSC